MSIDPYNLATIGQNSTQTFTLASLGILYDITIEDIIIPTIPIRGGNSSGDIARYTKEKVKGKLVTVTAIIKGEEYKEKVIVEGRPNLEVKDIKVEILENLDKPQIRILFS